jgi:hypothetical protein
MQYLLKRLKSENWKSHLFVDGNILIGRDDLDKCAVIMVYDDVDKVKVSYYDYTYDEVLEIYETNAKDLISSYSQEYDGIGVALEIVSFLCKWNKTPYQAVLMSEKVSWFNKKFLKWFCIIGLGVAFGILIGAVNPNNKIIIVLLMFLCMICCGSVAYFFDKIKSEKEK